MFVHRNIMETGVFVVSAFIVPVRKICGPSQWSVHVRGSIFIQLPLRTRWTPQNGALGGAGLRSLVGARGTVAMSLHGVTMVTTTWEIDTYSSWVPVVQPRGSWVDITLFR